MSAGRVALWCLAAALAGCAAPPRSSTQDAAPATQGAAASAQDDVADLFARLNAVRRRAEHETNPLARFDVYRDAWEHSSGPLRGFIGQGYAAEEAALGRYAQAVLDFPMGQPRLREPGAPLPTPDTHVAVDAVDAIVELAANRRAVLLNEAHHVAQSRVLTLALLPRLRALGYTHFAAESLDERDVDLAARGYPLDSTGPYAREPLYGELVRRALALGYVVVPYDSRHEQRAPSARESDQADNLYTRVFAHDPNARLLLQGGYAHVHEKAGYLFDATPMALLLKRRIGSDPLSVDQTVLKPSAPDREYADYGRLLDAFHPPRASVLRARADGAPWSLEPAYYDVSVLQPRPALVHGRPDWLSLDGARRAVPVEARWCRDVVPCLVEARYAGESAQAVPADRLIRVDAQPQELYLFPGRYAVLARDAEGTRLGALEIDVPR